MLKYVKLIPNKDGTLTPTAHQTWATIDPKKSEKQLIQELTPYMLWRGETNMFMALCEIKGRKILRNIYCIEKLGKGALQECKRRIEI